MIEKLKREVFDRWKRDSGSFTSATLADLEQILNKIDQVIDAVNRIDTALAIPVRDHADDHKTMDPAPVQPKPLRDGDVCINDKGIPKIFYLSIYSSEESTFDCFCNSAMGYKPIGINILNLAQCARDGGCVVALTKDEASAIVKDITDGFHYGGAIRKVRAAIEEGK